MSKKEKAKKYLRRADDLVEEMKRKMRSMDGVLFFMLQGMEFFYHDDNCYEVSAVEMIRDYLVTLQDRELAELEKQLEHLRKF